MRISFVYIQLLALALYSCNPKSQNETAGVEVPVVTKAVTAKNYLSGKKFCEIYKAITSKEISKYVSVPLSYEKESSETLELYTYTVKPFDPNKPTIIFLDGGPGQNTHGMREYLPEGVNQINFDQRGLGCSAPATFAQYRDASLFSTENTVKDIESIRKAYGLDKVTVYGVSYGTVPATIYGSLNKNTSRSVILEGVVGDLEKIHNDYYKVEKLNLALEVLNKAQRKAIEDGLGAKNKDIKNLLSLMSESFYSNGGMDIVKTRFLSKFFREDGSIVPEVAKDLAERMKEEEKYPHEQQPGAVDEHIYSVISCKDLNKVASGETTIRYSAEKGFFTASDPGGRKEYTEFCKEHGVDPAKVTPYDYAKYKLEVPAYYFQGSHDGATLAEGAINHWKHNAKGNSYFMLLQKGGHNPYLSMVRGIKPDEKDQERVAIQKMNYALFVNAVNGQEITRDNIAEVNATKAKHKWVLYLAADLNTDQWKTELEGIKEFREDILSF